MSSIVQGFTWPLTATLSGCLISGRVAQQSQL